jgi:hypothetical protein
MLGKIVAGTAWTTVSSFAKISRPAFIVSGKNLM